MTVKEIKEAKEYIESNIASLIMEFNKMSPLKIESVIVTNQSFTTDDGIKIKVLKNVEVKIEDI